MLPEEEVFPCAQVYIGCLVGCEQISGAPLLPGQRCIGASIPPCSETSVVLGTAGLLVRGGNSARAAGPFCSAALGGRRGIWGFLALQGEALPKGSWAELGEATDRYQGLPT